MDQIRCRICLCESFYATIETGHFYGSPPIGDLRTDVKENLIGLLFK
jgi:hypothetical protein